MRIGVRAHLASLQVSRVVYGAIIGMALIVAQKDHPPSAVFVVGSLLGTAAAVGLAEFYSGLVGTRTRTREHVEPEQVRELVMDTLAVAFGIAFPALFFILAALGAMEVQTAFTLATWSGLGLIGFYGFAAARLSGAGWAASLLQAAAVGAIGGALIALKALLH
jgi:VIT1/CCC1 family predicted Fe2+/Mn2+ transporter